MNIGIDLDGTICITNGMDYQHSRPVSKVINKINLCYAKGDKITIYTARGSTTGLDWRMLTENQLKAWGVKYHQLLFGKPVFGLYIGDEAINVKEFVNGDSSTARRND